MHNKLFCFTIIHSKGKEKKTKKRITYLVKEHRECLKFIHPRIPSNCGPFLPFCGGKQDKICTSGVPPGHNFIKHRVKRNDRGFSQFILAEVIGPALYVSKKNENTGRL